MSTQPGPGIQRLLTMKQVCEILGCSQMHLVRLVKAGEITVIDIATPGAGRAKNRVSSEELARYVAKSTVF
jgi:excisionase family DNA binding protein